MDYRILYLAQLYDLILNYKYEVKEVREIESGAFKVVLKEVNSPYDHEKRIYLWPKE